MARRGLHHVAPHGPNWRRPVSLLLLALAITARAETTSNNTGDQLQAFTYQLTDSSRILPVTASCPAPLTVTALTPTNAGGPDPVAPYTMIALVHEQLEDGAGQTYERMYARSMDIGNMDATVNMSHPWMPGTQFISCVWASNGVSGGCQDLYTVVDGADTADAYANATSECRTTDVMASWVTPPAQTLAVDVQGVSGTISINSWPAACSDLMFTPMNGTAPYTLLIAPAQHPPVNISSTSSRSFAMNYTVRLTHGQAFAAAVFDSAGNSFMIGPLHSGAADDLSCLAVATGQAAAAESSGVSVGALSGGVVGAFVAGALGAGLLAWLYARRKKRVGRWHEDSREELDPYDLSGPEYTLKPTPYTPPHTVTGRGYDPLMPAAHAQMYRDAVGLGDFEPAPAPGSSGSYGSAGTAADSAPGTHGMAAESTETSGTPGSGTRLNAINSDKAGRMSVHSSGTARSPRANRLSHLPDDVDEQHDRHARNVYVVHADGGADVHIQLPVGGANVYELPPFYQHDDAPRREAEQPASPVHTPGTGPAGAARLLPPMEATPTGGSRHSADMSAEEQRARAEAAQAEKERLRSEQL